MSSAPDFSSAADDLGKRGGLPGDAPISCGDRPEGRQVSDRAVGRNHMLSRHGALLLGDEQVLIQAGIGESPELR